MPKRNFPLWALSFTLLLASCQLTKPAPSPTGFSDPDSNATAEPRIQSDVPFSSADLMPLLNNMKTIGEFIDVTQPEFTTAQTADEATWLSTDAGCVCWCKIPADLTDGEPHAFDGSSDDTPLPEEVLALDCTVTRLVFEALPDITPPRNVTLGATRDEVLRAYQPATAAESGATCVFTAGNATLTYTFGENETVNSVIYQITTSSAKNINLS